MDVVKGWKATRRYQPTSNPIEQMSTDNVIEEPEEITVTGQLSATPLAFNGAAGVAGSLLRRDLTAVTSLRAIFASRQTVFVVTPARNYPNMVGTLLDESHDGRNKVDLTIAFRKVKKVSILGLVSVDVFETLFGDAGDSPGGIQPTAAMPDAGGVG